MEEIKTLKVEDYGDMLSKVTGKKLISYTCFGSYQGEWVATLEDGENLEIWKGYYGSCSGCDSMEAEKDWSTGCVNEEWAKSYFKEDRPFAVIPKETLERIDDETFAEMLPANIRASIYEFSATELFEDVKKGLGLSA